MADFGYSNCYQKPKKFNSIANCNVADSGMIALTDEPLHVEKLKKNESLNVDIE